MPLGQSTTPYQIYDAFFDVTKAATGWDIDTVKQSLHVLSQTIDQTYPHLSATLEGVAKFSDTIGKRDEEIKHLLAQANQVASILGDRSQQVDRLLVNAKTLIAAFNERGRAIDALLGNIASFSAQVQGLINDNPNLNHVLEQLRQVSDILVERKDDLANGLLMVGGFLPSLNESIASGPFFKVVIHNLVPGQILQPFIDAAFKKRGLDPENFWRSAGLPEFRWPDPNGTRFPNGAPPPAPGVLEGTPEHPGRPSRPVHPARTRRPIPAAMSPSATRGCRGRGTRCPARVRSSARSEVRTSRRRWMSRRPRRTRTACRRRRASRSRAAGRPAAGRSGYPGAAAAERTAGCAHRAAGAGRPDTAAVDVRAGLPPGPPAPPGPGRSCPTPISTQEAPAVAV
ncbi:mCE-family protein Mce1C [Mycobacterium kansasii]|uniref:MCE-family protein Mce1C n=1 Tax=Mycobacterium kansasii TaxID=1768 RepID=A0A1V3WCB3_MYCKA|nr:mCE-family protein Mce1C [Mycobacterium kansasii]